MAGESHQIVVAESFDEAAIARLAELGNVVRLENCEAETLTAAVSNCDALLVRSAARVTEEVIASAKASRRLQKIPQWLVIVMISISRRNLRIIRIHVIIYKICS